MSKMTLSVIVALTLSACAGTAPPPPAPEAPAEPGPIEKAEQPFPPEVNAALPEGIPASAVRLQDGCFFYRFGDEIRPVSFDGVNPICKPEPAVEA